MSPGSVQCLSHDAVGAQGFGVPGGSRQSVAGKPQPGLYLYRPPLDEEASPEAAERPTRLGVARVTAAWAEGQSL